MSGRNSPVLLVNPPAAPARRDVDPGLAGRVRRLRVERGLTQQELADGHCSKEYVSQIERGKTRPTAETISWLAERLGVDSLFIERGVVGGDYARDEALVAQAEQLIAGKRHREAVEALAGCVVRPEAPELRLRALLAEGWARMYEGELDTAVALLEEAQVLAEDELFGPVEQADVLFRLGCCRYKLSAIGAAIGLFDQALRRAEASGQPCFRLRADVLGWRARCHRRQRDWESARDDIDRALELAELLDDPELEANTLFQASLVAEREGHWPLARRLADRARELYEQLEDHVNVGRQLNNLGGFEFLLGNAERAAELMQQALELARRIGSTPDAAQALCSLAEVELSTGDDQLAEQHTREAILLLDGRDDFIDVIGTAELRLGKSLLAQGRLDEAGAAFAAAEQTFTRMQSASHLAAVWSAQGELAAARGDMTEAAACYRHAAESLQDFHF